MCRLYTYFQTLALQNVGRKLLAFYIAKQRSNMPIAAVFSDFYGRHPDRALFGGRANHRYSRQQGKLLTQGINGGRFATQQEERPILIGPFGQHFATGVNFLAQLLCRPRQE